MNLKIGLKLIPVKKAQTLGLYIVISTVFGIQVSALVGVERLFS